MGLFSRQMSLWSCICFWFASGSDLWQCEQVFFFSCPKVARCHFACGSGNWDRAIFTSGVRSPLDDERRSIAVIFFPLSQTNENRLNHRQNLEIINLKDQASHDSGNVPFQKTKNMPIMLAVLLL